MNTPNQSNFDQIARPYRWLEYLTFGRSLERCRFHFLPQLRDRTNALVMGDGDGRFSARLLTANPKLQADAVDTSATMLELLHRRCKVEAPNAAVRLTCHQADAATFVQHESRTGPSYDLIVTHFFLDCLNQTYTNALAKAVAKKAMPGAIWIVSDFRIPAGLMRVPARVLIRSLYLAFRVLTGLRTQNVPDHSIALSAAGFVQNKVHYSMGGALFSELWIFDRYGHDNRPAIM